MKAFLAPLALMMLLITSSMMITLVAPVEAQGGMVTLKPTDDTYIAVENYNNYGSSVMLRVCLAHYITWLKFDLSSIPEGAVGITAVLELYTTYNGVTNPHAVTSCLHLNNSWSEATLTSENAPGYLDAEELDTDYVANDETWYEWNVTEAVVNATSSNATAVTILMRYPYPEDATSLSFNSKEASMTKFPKLTISWTDIVLEFPSLVILPLFMLATLSVAIVFRRKHSVKAISV